MVGCAGIANDIAVRGVVNRSLVGEVGAEGRVGVTPLLGNQDRAMQGASSGEWKRQVT